MASATRNRLASFKKLLDAEVEDGLLVQDCATIMQCESIDELGGQERKDVDKFLASCNEVWSRFAKLQCSLSEIKHLHQLLNEVLRYKEPDRARLNDLITILDKEINSFTVESAQVCQRVNQINSDVKGRLKEDGAQTRIQRSQMVSMMERLYLIIAEFNREQIGYQEENRSQAAVVAQRQSIVADDASPESLVTVSMTSSSDLRDVLSDVINRHEATLHIEAAVDELNQMFQHFLIITERGTSRANDIDKNMEEAKDYFIKIKEETAKAAETNRKKRKTVAILVPVVVVTVLFVMFCVFMYFYLKFALIF